RVTSPSGLAESAPPPSWTTSSSASRSWRFSSAGSPASSLTRREAARTSSTESRIYSIGQPWPPPPKGRVVAERLELVPLTLREANAFVAEHHRHAQPVRGCVAVVG